MNKINSKQLGFLLGYIFLYPIIYQSFHVILDHHGFKSNAIETCCLADPGECNDQYETKKEICPVCKFEVTIFKLDYSENLFIKRFYYNDQSIYIEQNHFIVFSGSLTNLRAPPSLT